jgi:hypothetical protein
MSFNFKVLGTAAQWLAKNPTLAVGEMGLETDTGLFKVGDGLSEWTNLSYSLNTGGITGATGSAGGATGATGSAGGVTGANGVTGATGSAGGATGATGSAGGVTGATGTAGQATTTALATQVLFNTAGGITGSSNFTYVNPLLSVANIQIGVGSTGGSGFTVSTTTNIQQVTESINTRATFGTSNTFDYTNGAIVYVTNQSNNFTANIFNVPTSVLKAITYTFIYIQGTAPSYCSNLYINSVSNTINWANGIVPTPNSNKRDVQTFTMINNSVTPGVPTFTVLGDYSTYG